MSDDQVTPVSRPVANPANKPLVMVLHNLALTLEATPRALAEIARDIQRDPAPTHSLNKERIAGVLDEHVAAVAAAAKEIREG